MVFKKFIFATAVLAVALSSPAVTHETKNPAAPSSPIDLPPPVHHVDLADLLDVAGPFQTFLNYLQKTSVIETFQSQADHTKAGITIFVPRDSAFAALKKKKKKKTTPAIASLTKAQLKSLLLYHALPRFYSLAEVGSLRWRSPAATFAGSQYTLNLTEDIGTIRVRSAWSNAKIGSTVYGTAPVAVYEVDKFSCRRKSSRASPCSCEPLHLPRAQWSAEWRIHRGKLVFELKDVNSRNNHV
jgi:uncharacterized surface protein with fasciclin (FAS1) repeats